MVSLLFNVVFVFMLIYLWAFNFNPLWILLHRREVNEDNILYRSFTIDSFDSSLSSVIKLRILTKRMLLLLFMYNCKKYILIDGCKTRTGPLEYHFSHRNRCCTVPETAQEQMERYRRENLLEFVHMNVKVW